MNYTHLTQDERYQIAVLHKAGHKQNAIAKLIGRNESSISREMRRNRGQRGYRPKQAQALYQRIRELGPDSIYSAISRLGLPRGSGTARLSESASTLALKQLSPKPKPCSSRPGWHPHPPWGFAHGTTAGMPPDARHLHAQASGTTSGKQSAHRACPVHPHPPFWEIIQSLPLWPRHGL
ncbi:MAG: helix-turn-helix domain-containing protein [Sulfuricella sp.]